MAEPAGDGGPANPNAGRWEQRFNEAGSRAEDELRKVVRFIDEEVVPEIRRNGSTALRRASSELERLARYMDDHHGPDPADKP